VEAVDFEGDGGVFPARGARFADVSEDAGVVLKSDDPALRHRTLIPQIIPQA
jgi:hypothetical protein